MGNTIVNLDKSAQEELKKIIGKGETEIIEVTKLPSIWKGTPIPNEGHVDKIYFNTNISTNNVIDIISKLTYIEDPEYPDGDGLKVYYIIEAENASESDIGYYIMNYGDMYAILDYSYTSTIFTYNNPETSDGWQNIKELPIDENVVSESTVILPGSVGAENNLLSSIFSVTPFEYLNEVDESKIYKLNDNGVYSYWRYVNDQWIEVIKDSRDPYIEKKLNDNTTNIAKNKQDIATNKQDITDLKSGGGRYYSPDEISLFSFIPSDTFHTFRVGGTNLKVDWGDGETEVINDTITHTYAKPYERVMVVIEKGTITKLGINRNVDFVSLGKNNITDMTDLLTSCENIRMISYFNTSNTTDTKQLFAWDTELLEVPFMDVSKVTYANDMFHGCSKLVSVPPLNFNAVTNIVGLFENCHSLIEVPLFDTSNAGELNNLFSGCNSLVEVPRLDAGKTYSMTNTFKGCTSLRRIHMSNFYASFDITDTALEHDALIEVISNLKPLEGATKTLTMGAEKLALLSDEEKAVATEKGWILA